MAIDNRLQTLLKIYRSTIRLVNRYTYFFFNLQSRLIHILIIQIAVLLDIDPGELYSWIVIVLYFCADLFYESFPLLPEVLTESNCGFLFISFLPTIFSSWLKRGTAHNNQ